MAKEIERKFLVAGDAWRDQVQSSRAITQAYIVSADEKSVRVRRYDDGGARLTIKIGAPGLVREEFEYDIPDEDADELIRHHIGRPIEKVRHRVPAGTFTFEVDEFGGALRGLVLAEVELADADAAPDLPDWLGREVTGEEAFENRCLAIWGLPPDSAPHLLSS